MSRLLWVIPLTLIILFAIFIPGIIKENVFVLGGSTSIYNIWNKATNLENYKNLGYKIQYNSIGSLAAKKRVLDGVFDIGYASHDIKLTAKEKLILQKKNLATDFLALVYNLPKNCKLKQSAQTKSIQLKKQDFKNLFLQKDPTWDILRAQVEKYYDCDTNIWKQKIFRINRENGSGTRLSFEDFFQFEKLYKYDQQMKSTNQLIKTLKIQHGSLTYFSLSFLNNVIIDKAIPNQLGIFILEEEPDIKHIFDHLENNIVNNKNLLNKLQNYRFKHKFVGYYLKKHQPKLKKLFDLMKREEFKNILYQMKIKPHD